MLIHKNWNNNDKDTNKDRTELYSKNLEVDNFSANLGNLNHIKSNNIGQKESQWKVRV